jgi:hypothetical protein
VHIRNLNNSYPIPTMVKPSPSTIPYRYAKNTSEITSAATNTMPYSQPITSNKSMARFQRDQEDAISVPSTSKDYGVSMLALQDKPISSMSVKSTTSMMIQKNQDKRSLLSKPI